MLPPSLQLDLPDLSNDFLGVYLKRDWFCWVGETYPSFFFVKIFCFRSPERKRKFTNKQTRQLSYLIKGVIRLVKRPSRSRHFQAVVAARQVMFEEEILRDEPRRRLQTKLQRKLQSTRLFAANTLTRK